MFNVYDLQRQMVNLDFHFLADYKHYGPSHIWKHAVTNVR